jgi:hypothetical protein
MEECRWRCLRRREGVARPEAQAPPTIIYLVSAAVLEPPAVAAGLDDVAVVGDAVEECGRHFGIAEHAGPLAERQVVGDDHRGLLLELADQAEQQLAAGERANSR